MINTSCGDAATNIQPDTELGFELSRAALAIDSTKSMMQPLVLETDEFRFGIQFQMPASASSFKLHIHDVGDYEQALA